MNTHQVWRIDPTSPSYHTRASLVGEPTTEADAKRRAVRHNGRIPWTGHQAHWVVLPIGQCPPEATKTSAPEFDDESLAYIREQARR
jgi:hypothetical protein